MTPTHANEENHNSIQLNNQTEYSANYRSIELPLNTDLTLWTLVSCGINEEPNHVWERFLSRSLTKDEIWLKTRYIRHKRKRGAYVNCHDHFFEALLKNGELHTTPIRLLLGNLTFKRVQVIDANAATLGIIGRVELETNLC